MYSQKTRNIIIGSILTSVIVVGSILLIIILYITTDLFKSNENLFYKYMGQTFDSLKYVENLQLSEIDNLKEEKPYKVDGKFIYKVSDLNTNSVNTRIDMELLQNNPQKESYANFALIHNTEKIFNVEYAKSNDIVALKSPEIVNAFLGTKNENLQELAKKIGITNTTLLPNSIKDIKLNELLNITEDQRNYIIKTYLKVLQQNIDKSKFTKEKNLAVSRDGENYKTTAYHLNLTNEELKQVKIAILQALKEDDKTLNIIAEKMKILGLDSEENNNLKSLIQNVIDNINHSSNSQELSGINIMLYATGGRIITTEIIYENSIKCTIYGTSTKNESKRYLLIENLNVDTEFQKIEFNENEIRNESESSYNAIININDKTQVKVNLLNKGSAVEEKLTSEFKAEIDEQSKTQTISYEGDMKFNNNNTQSIVKLNKNNCGMLDEYEENQLKTVVEAVVKRTKEVINQKLKTIGIEIN